MWKGHNYESYEENNYFCGEDLHAAGLGVSTVFVSKSVGHDDDVGDEAEEGIQVEHIVEGDYVSSKEDGHHQHNETHPLDDMVGAQKH